jgi:tetratricopeptide (TPR) repeat protein
LLSYGKAISIEPSAFHHNNRGLAYYHLNQQEEAKKDFDAAVSKQPMDATILFNRGNVYLNWKPTPEFELA